MRKTADLVPTIEAAQILEVNVATVNLWARTGRLKVTQKLPGERGANLFSRRDVQRLATERERALAPKRKAGAA